MLTIECTSASLLPMERAPKTFGSRILVEFSDQERTWLELNFSGFWFSDDDDDEPWNSHSTITGYPWDEGWPFKTLTWFGDVKGIVCIRVF